jgi:DNA invertase Pin-like site-specific DNA recombinase
MPYKQTKKMENTNEIKETKRGTRKPRAKRATAAEGDENAIFIGTLIQQELKNQERTVSWLARKLDCDRTNVYNIFRRQDIDTELLMRISVILHRDFFAIFSKEAKRKISADPGI